MTTVKSLIFFCKKILEFFLVSLKVVCKKDFLNKFEMAGLDIKIQNSS